MYQSYNGKHQSIVGFKCIYVGGYHQEFYQRISNALMFKMRPLSEKWKMTLPILFICTLTESIDDRCVNSVESCRHSFLFVATTPTQRVSHSVATATNSSRIRSILLAALFNNITFFIVSCQYSENCSCSMLFFTQRRRFFVVVNSLTMPRKMGQLIRKQYVLFSSHSFSDTIALSYQAHFFCSGMRCLTRSGHHTTIALILRALRVVFIRLRPGSQKSSLSVNAYTTESLTDCCLVGACYWHTSPAQSALNSDGRHGLCVVVGGKKSLFSPFDPIIEVFRHVYEDNSKLLLSSQQLHRKGRRPKQTR